MLPITLAAVAAAAAGCGDDGPTFSRVTEAEACRAVKERLTLKEVEDRFGKPDATQDFFGDKVLVYDLPDAKWQFQVSAQTGTFRALRVKGSKEEIVDCPA